MLLIPRGVLLAWGGPGRLRRLRKLSFRRSWARGNVWIFKHYGVVTAERGSYSSYSDAVLTRAGLRGRAVRHGLES